MRTLFLLLLLANVAFFAWSMYGDQLSSEDSGVLSQQINREAIRLLRPEQSGTLAGEVHRVACVEWGAVTGSDVARAQEAFAPLQLGPRLSERRVEETANFWVFVPPQPNRQAATQKAQELKNLGVQDYFIVQDDPKYRNAISLGVFRSEDAAKGRLEQLRVKGVRSARLGPKEMQVQKTYFQLRDPGGAITAKLNEFKQSFPGTEIRDCGQ